KLKKDETIKKEKEENKKKAAKKLAKNNAAVAGVIFDDSYRNRFFHIPALKDLLLNRTCEVSVFVKGRKFSTGTDQSGFFCVDMALTEEKCAAIIEIKSPDNSKAGNFKIETAEISIKKGKINLVKIYAGADSKFKFLTKEGASYKQETDLAKVKENVRKQMKKAEKGARSLSSIIGKVANSHAGGVTLIRTGFFFEMPKMKTDANGRDKDLEINAKKTADKTINDFADIKLLLIPGNKTAKAGGDGSFTFKGPLTSDRYILTAAVENGPKKEKIINISTDDYGYSLNGILMKLNTPPETAITQISGTSGEILIKYDLFDIDSDECAIELNYSTDGGATYRKTSAISGDVVHAGTGKNKIIRWNSRADIKNGCFPNATVKLVSYDGFEKSAPAVSAKFFLNNNHSPIISNVSVSESSGEVSVKCDLTDEDGDPCKIDVYYSIDLGKNYKKTENVTGDILKITPGREKMIKWSSAKDCAENIKTGRLRLSPNDGIDAGQSGYSAVIELKNNHFRPAVSNIDIIGDSNEIKVKYDLDDKENNACTVEILYSTDGGKSFTKPNNASGNLKGIVPGRGKTIFWYSRFDFTDNRPEVIVRLVPADAAGSGREASSKIFPVYNNLPPVVTNINYSGASDEIILKYDLSDAEKDNATIEVYFSIDNGATFTKTEHIKGDMINITPETNRVIKWSSRADVAGNAQYTRIKIVPYSAISAGSPVVSSPFYLKNNRAPAVFNVETSGASNEITLAFDLEDPDDNECFMELYYSLDDGENYVRTAHIDCREDAASSPRPGREKTLKPGLRRIIKWKSQFDFKTNQPKVKLKIIANDGFEYGAPAFSGTILVGNRQLPVISNVTAAGSSNEIVIKYDLEDKENGTNSIRVWYSPDNGANYVKTVNVTGDIDKMTSGRAKTILWYSKKDFNTKYDNVIVRVTPNDGNINGIDGFTKPFPVNNNNRPAISNAMLTGASGDIAIKYDLADIDKNNCTIEVLYSVDSGKTFTKTENLTGDIKNIQPGASHLVTWNSAADINDKKDAVIIKLIPEDGVEYGEPFSLPALTLDNSRFASVSNVVIGDISANGLVKINYNLEAYNNEATSVEVYFSFDAGRTFERTFNISGDTAGVPVGRNRKMQWDSILDTMSDHAGAIIKIIPYNSIGRGCPDKSKRFNISNAPDVLSASTGESGDLTAAASTAYSARASHVALSFKNKIWIIGGWAGNPNFKSELFSSPDGANWASESGIAFAARHSHAGLVYKDRMWIIGGFNGTAKNDVWSSADGANWIENTKDSTESVRFTPRTSHAAVVFKNRMWVIGGFGAGYKNDIWFSYDGANWAEATSETAFTPRTGHAVFVFNDKLYIVGGYDGTKYLNDIWSSANGTDWQKLPINSPFEPRQHHAVIVMDKKLWLIGGDNDDTLNDIWFSDNAADWRNIPFAKNDDKRIVPANGRASLLHNGRIFITGGYDGISYRNDTLVLKVK
ncbi:MAG TPA: kelch repeat-containing protein, partial [Candidatus Wallbacteria bacterium]|nr:kelch repeat-containing protein [Candidatus Wallbacteria bacterium]